ncbi:archaetidylserine decarboxylase [Limnobacter humi]|uniref:phosphatidylserine decarboxylase n=1 Tax=Limnobacter humi TaxID=1778671 RepID=A0ABT1WFI3_9BURK|nr:archaetidylserine decarboxylase [Limnobacter humi]MCQ8896129.1 archaetidylserine decarboxylase [Limnobacter humi]
MQHNQPDSWLDALNFWVTNRIPRLAASRCMGRISQIRQPFFVRLALWAWNRITPLQLHEANQTQFRSIHDCFTRALKPGQRPVDPAGNGVSPCDGEVVSHGLIQEGQLFQVKGLDYSVQELLIHPDTAARYANHQFITLRIRASQYHRLHAPTTAQLTRVDYIQGDTFNVNPPTVKRLEKLYCRNERAVLHLKGSQGEPVAMVAVAAILVAGIRLHATGLLFNQSYAGQASLSLNQAVQRGEELGWFEHGSTVILLVPATWQLHPSITPGSGVRMGQCLWVCAD